VTITVKCFATLSKYQPKSERIDISEGESVGAVLRRLGIPSDAVTIVFVNNVRRTLEAPLGDGDVLGLFPKLGGG
jgi:molybdopterin converting factor small subunit